MKRIFVSLLTLAVMGVTATVGHAQADSERVWTIAEVLSERKEPVDIASPRMCNGERYKPCVCAPDVSALVQYRPSVKQCGGNAAVVLSGRYIHAFSVVVRDRVNRDRFPSWPGFNGCSQSQFEAGLSKCSAFKVQKVLAVSSKNGNAEVHCLGASGYSKLFRAVTRMTIKLKDVPGSSSDPLERLCLSSPKKPLN